jgi:CRP-like cAMP-binding protein
MNLVQHIRKFVDLTDSEMLVLNQYVKSHKLKKKAYLLEEGKICRDLYFVEKGCLRMFFLNKKTVEQITQFALGGWWISDYFSFMDSTPSDYFIQSIEKSEIVSIDKSRFDELLAELPQLERYFRLIMQKTLAASQLRTKYLSEMSKEEFYLHFSASFPEFMQRVPQYMIASYLGLTPEYLSELRKKKL